MLQIITFNIGGARKLRQSPHNPGRLGHDTVKTLLKVINPDEPTFIALQETGEITWQHNQHSSAIDAMCLTLPHHDRYYGRFAPELTTTLHPHLRLWGREPYTRMRSAAEGNGFVTNMPFAKWDWGVFEGVGDYWTYTQISEAALYSSGNRNTQPRNAVVASVEHPVYGDLYIINTHYGTVTGEDRHAPTHERTLLGEATRRHQSREILRIVSELRQAEIDHEKPARPIILTGDFNATPEADSMTDLREVFTLLEIENPPDEQWSHEGHKILIDHIFVSDPRGVMPGARCFIQTDLPYDDLTDHRPVVAIFGG